MSSPYTLAAARPFRPDLFVGAQAILGDQALAELRAGRKRTHWMWFVFPQHVGLGRSYRSTLFGLTPLSSREFWGDEFLRDRYLMAVDAVNALPDVEAAFGPVDAVKLRSSLTLFDWATCGLCAPVRLALDRHFSDVHCEQTVRLIDLLTDVKARGH